MIILYTKLSELRWWIWICSIYLDLEVINKIILSCSEFYLNPLCLKKVNNFCPANSVRYSWHPSDFSTLLTQCVWMYCAPVCMCLSSCIISVTLISVYRICYYMHNIYIAMCPADACAVFHMSQDSSNSVTLKCVMDGLLAWLNIRQKQYVYMDLQIHQSVVSENDYLNLVSGAAGQNTPLFLLHLGLM